MKALFIGRFQPLHKGHMKVLEYGCSHYDELIIGIGSSQYGHTLENPFTAEERKQMLEHSLADQHITNFQIIFIPDIHNPPQWVSHVRSIVPEFDVVLSNNDFTTRLFSEKGYVVKKTPIYRREQYAGKETRRRMIASEPWDSLVPKPVLTVIQNIKGVQRIKDLADS